MNQFDANAPQYKSASQHILRLLMEANGEYVADLYHKTNSMVHSRIADLRKKGHRIECKCFGERDYRYRLLSPELVEPV